jgi:hypothetical protein
MVKQVIKYYRDREGFSHLLSSIKSYFAVMFDILPLKFGLVDCVWDKVMICNTLGNQ